MSMWAKEDAKAVARPTIQGCASLMMLMGTVMGPTAETVAPSAVITKPIIADAAFLNVGSRVTIRWDGTDARGRAMPSGVYFFRLTAGTSERLRKAVLLR